MNKKIYLVKGHRGTGKTTWVKSLKKNLKDMEVFDLDEEIEKQKGKSISQLFSLGNFRKIEKQVFKNLTQKVQSLKTDVFISVGAGFEGSVSFPVIVLRRPNDSQGRIFFNRPRLLPQESPFDEYQKIYQQRDQKFCQEALLVLTRLDYYKSFECFDRVFLGTPLPFKNSVLPLVLNPNLKSQSLKSFINHKIKMGFGFFELCDQFLTEEQFNDLISQIPLHQLRFRLLSSQNHFMRNFLAQNHSLKVDWPLELGIKDDFLKKIKKEHEVMYSLHQREAHQTLDQILKQLSDIEDTPVKLAVEIFSFAELKKAHQWQQKNPKKRLFYPRLNGKWKWYRLLFNQSLYFIREKDEEIRDQPLMAESVQIFQTSLGHPREFACVLGDPIEHSATPYIQESFFKKYKMPVLKIPMTEDEMTLENLNILKSLGMRFSAITSPLKKKAFEIIQQKSTPVKALNTLILVEDEWFGLNTDISGALSLKEQIQEFHTVAVWGGGGVIDSLKFAFGRELQDVSFYAARTGKLKSGSGKNPDCVIWAVDRSRMKEAQFPPSDWKPNSVFDLNYTENSPALEYALNVQSKYVSGWKWFEAQAFEQRKLFEKLYKRKK